MTLEIIPDAIAEVRRLLDRAHYDEHQRRLRRDYHTTPFPTYTEWKKTSAGLADRARLAYQLLLFGDAVAEDEAARAWGAVAVDAVVAVGLARREGAHLHTTGYSIISRDGAFVVVSLAVAYPNATGFDSPVYVGPDSYYLARALPRDRHWTRVLDLCAGSGLCGILLSEYAEQVHATELHPLAVNAGRFNVLINGLAERIHLHMGSLYEPVGDARFDLVVANPPFLPVPRDLAHPLAMCGNGGDDGFSVLGALLDGLHDHLTPNGQALIYAEGTGSEGPHGDDLVIAERLAALARSDDFDVTLELIARMPIKQMLRMKRIALARQGAGPLAEMPRWQALYESYAATHIYNFIVRVRPGAGRLVVTAAVPDPGAEPFFASGKGTFVAEAATERLVR